MCGSRKHGFLKGSPKKELIHLAHVSCPVTVYERSNETLWISTPLQEYDICKHGLAESIQYEASRIPQLMKDYMKYGRGRHQTQETCNTLKDILIQICETHHIPQRPTKRKTKEDHYNDSDEERDSKRKRSIEG